MKPTRGVLIGLALISAIVSLSGCGGTKPMTSFNIGKYDGTVSNPGKTSTLVEVSVNGDGKLSGMCTMLSSTSGAIMARATVTGSANPQTGEFTADGMYQCFIPPPPDGTGSGPIAITGAIPPKGIATGPLHVQDSVTSLNGVLAQSPTL